MEQQSITLDVENLLIQRAREENQNAGYQLFDGVTWSYMDCVVTRALKHLTGKTNLGPKEIAELGRARITIEILPPLRGDAGDA